MTNTQNYNWQGKTILIVEDEDVNYLFLRQAIIRYNPEILWATNGEDAIETCKNNQDIDLILMDIKMPVMSGTKATIEIKKLYPELPIIVQTAYAMVNERQQILKAGCDEYLTKPVRVKKLLKTMAKYL